MRLWYYFAVVPGMLIRVFRYVMLPAVGSRASASISNGQHFCRPQNHDYDMAIKLVIMSYASVALGRSVVSFLAAICLFVCFSRLYSVRAAIDSDTRCSYIRLHVVQQTNLHLS